MSRISMTLLCLVLMTSSSAANQPGVKARITKKGIDYANTVAHDKLAKELNTLAIPNQSGKDGHISWSLSNVQNRGSTVPRTLMTLTPGQKGLTWSMSNLGIKLHSDWRVKYKKGWIKASTSGSVDINVKGVSLQVIITLGADLTKGSPTISMAGCSANVADVDLKFHGGTAFILNMFKGTLGRKVRNLLKDQICKVVQKEINEDGAKALAKLKLTVPLAKRFLLDYRLMQAPGVEATFLDTEHKGEVFWIGDTTEAPMSPKPFPALTNDTNMMYLWLSDYTANSMAYVAQKHNFLRYNLTAQDLPAGKESFLNTTCKLKCIGTFIPQIGNKYPNSVVEARIASRSMPVMKISPESMTFSCWMNISLYAHTPDKKIPFLLTLGMNLSLTLQASVRDEKVTGSITDHTFKVGVLESAIGNVSGGALNLILNGAMSLFVIPKLNALAQTGFDLPVTGNLKLINTSITQFEGSFVISTDLVPLKSQSLEFISERHQP